MLTTAIESLRWVHILAGAVGLIAFWYPLFAKKGSINHKRIGKIFVNCGYVVVWAGVFVLLLKMIILAASDKTFDQAKNEISFALFLGYLCLTTGTILRHGMLVLTHKKDQSVHGTLLNYAFAYACLIASIILIGFAYFIKPSSAILLYAMSPIGFLTYMQIKGYISSANTSKQQWWYEHLSALIISGIAFHTAFAVFGSVRFINLGLEGMSAIIPWLAPTFIGVPAMIIWERYYRNKFNDPKPKRIKTEIHG